MEAKLLEQNKKMDSRLESMVGKLEELEYKFDSNIDSLMTGMKTQLKMLNKNEAQED